MNKKGFTLIELLATIVIIAIVAIIAVPTIGNIITDFSNRVYIESEKVFERTGRNYFLTNDELLPNELGETVFIKLDKLVEVAASEKIIDPKDQKECEGYLIVSKPTPNSYEYDAYIKCGTNYETPLYDMESAMEPSITLLGEDPVNIIMGQPYVDAGAQARDKYGNNLTSQIVVNNPVNINSSGIYQVTYTVTDIDGDSKTISRTVNILDSTPPVITLNGSNPYILWQHGTYVEPGYTATDNDLTDTTITSRVTTAHNIAPALPGSYTVTYTVLDKSGNIGTKTRTVNVTADPAPTVAFGTNGTVGSWVKTTSTTVTVSDVGSGVNTSSLEYQWTTSTTTPTEASFTTTFTNGATITTPAGITGTYYLWILAKDINNHTAILRSNVFNVDNTNPTITANNASSTWYASRTATVTGTDSSLIAEIRYQWNTNGMNAACTTGGTVTTTGTALIVPSGSNRLYICIRDGAGNTSTFDSGADQYRVDNTNPTVAFGTNGNSSWGTNRTTTVTISDADSGVNTSSLEYQWTTSTTAPTEASFTTIFTNGATITTPASVSGTYYLWILAKDNAGNTIITRSNVFNLDVGVPTIAANNASSTWYASRTATITGTDDIGIAEIRYSWNSNPMNAACTSGGTVTTTGTALTVPGGSNGLYLCIRDNAGLTGTWYSGANQYRVDDSNPTVTFGTNGDANWSSSKSTTVTISDSQSGVNTSTLKYQWTKSTTTPTEASFTTSFANGATITTPAGGTGTHYLWILAKDNSGKTSIISSNVFNLEIVTVYYMDGTYNISMGTPTKHGESGVYLTVASSYVRIYNNNDLYCFGGHYWPIGINLTNVTTIRFRAYSTTTSQDYYGQVRPSIGGAATRSIPIAYNSTATNYDMNVSDLTGTYYIYTDGYSRTQGRNITGITTISRQ